MQAAGSGESIVVVPTIKRLIEKKTVQIEPECSEGIIINGDIINCMTKLKQNFVQNKFDGLKWVNVSVIPRFAS